MTHVSDVVPGKFSDKIVELRLEGEAGGGADACRPDRGQLARARRPAERGRGLAVAGDAGGHGWNSSATMS